MATIKDVAKHAGVSVGTVSRFLNGAGVRRNNVERIERAIVELGYRPNMLGRSLVTGRSNSVGVLVANAGNVFAATVMAGLQPAFEGRGLTTLFVDYGHDVALLREKVDFLLTRSVDGLVVFLSELGRREDELGWLAELGVPVVVVDNPLMRAVENDDEVVVVDGRVDSVVVDNRGGVAEVVGAMLDAGHEHVGVLGLSTDTYVGSERLAGWREACEAHGFVAPECDARCGAATKEAGRVATVELLDAGGVTAIFACNYYLTLGALKAMGERGLRPGVDMGLAGFDDFDFSDVVVPPLTIVGQPTEDIVRVVSDLLVRRMGGDLEGRGLHVLPTTIRVTDSIARR